MAVRRGSPGQEHPRHDGAHARPVHTRLLVGHLTRDASCGMGVLPDRLQPALVQQRQVLVPLVGRGPWLGHRVTVAGRHPRHGCHSDIQGRGGHAEKEGALVRLAAGAREQAGLPPRRVAAGRRQARGGRCYRRSRGRHSPATPSARRAAQHREPREGLTWGGDPFVFMSSTSRTLTGVDIYQMAVKGKRLQ